MQKAAAERFIGIGLELGGKDPAYVRPDANMAHAVENLVDGAFFNSGQSCCGIERIYAHEKIYDEFVDSFVKLTRQYRLGNPLDANVNLGPMVRTRAAEFARGQVREAIAQGAKSLVDSEGVLRRQGRHAVHGAASAGQRESLDAPDERGELRAGDRHHESEGRR